MKKNKNIWVIYFLVFVLLLLCQGCIKGEYTSPSERAVAVYPDPDFNALFTRYEGGWTGGDGTYSVSLPDGRTVWIFGDSFVSPVDRDRTRSRDSKLIRNSLVIQDGQNLMTLYGGTSENPSALISPDDPNVWYWPIHGIAENHALNLFLALYKRAGPGDWDIEYGGRNDVATFSLPDLKLQNIKTINVNSNVSYGVWILKDDDYTYIYGLENLRYVKYSHIARSRPGRLFGPWEYFDGSGWSTNSDSTKRILKGVSSQYSVIKLGKRYFLITQTDFFGKEIVSYESKSSVGPWGHRRVLYITPQSDKNIYTYNTLAHPQFMKGGDLLISYNVNSFNIQDIYDNADNYRPYFIRVPVWRMFSNVQEFGGNTHQKSQFHKHLEIGH
jgi:hypothetical protein